MCSDEIVPLNSADSLSALTEPTQDFFGLPDRDDVVACVAPVVYHHEEAIMQIEARPNSSTATNCIIWT